MKLILPWIILLIFEGCSQPGSNIIIGKIDNIYSGTLKENRKIWVHVPGSENEPFSRSRRYPVVYLLDGDAHFASMTGLIQQLSEVNGNTLFPQMILVGITNTDRMRDLTPTHVAATYYGDSNGVRTSGGGEKFTDFIEKELIPYIDSLYPTEPYRILIGHSLGGLMVINMLVHHSGLFNAYLAIDPSMWWDGQNLLRQAETSLARGRFTGKTLFLAIANTMPQGMDTTMVRKDTSTNTLHIRSILRLADEIKENKGDGLRWNYKYYDKDSHGSVPLISEYDGLRFIFDFYNFPDPARLFDSSFNAAGALTAVSFHFKHISEQMGYRVLPPEPFVNGLGYNFLQSRMFPKAEGFFKLNIENYPNSSNVYDSMGDFYSASGDKQKAVDYYNKALSIHENPETRKKLEKLKTVK